MSDYSWSIPYKQTEAAVYHFLKGNSEINEKNIETCCMKIYRTNPRLTDNSFDFVEHCHNIFKVSNTRIKNRALQAISFLQGSQIHE